MEGSTEAARASPRVPGGGPPGYAQAGGARRDGAQHPQHTQHGAAEVWSDLTNML